MCDGWPGLINLHGLNSVVFLKFSLLLYFKCSLIVLSIVDSEVSSPAILD